MDEKISGILLLFSHMERMENDRIAKRVYVAEFAGRPWKRRIGTVKDCLNKRGLDVGQARRMMYDRSVWQGSM